MDPPSPHDRLRQPEPIGDDGVDVQIDRPIEVMLLEQKVHLSRRPQRFVIAIECGKEPILIESREENQITVGRPLVLHAVEIEENIC